MCTGEEAVEIAALRLGREMPEDRQVGDFPRLEAVDGDQWGNRRFAVYARETVRPPGHWIVLVRPKEVYVLRSSTSVVIRKDNGVVVYVGEIGDEG